MEAPHEVGFSPEWDTLGANKSSVTNKTNSPRKRSKYTSRACNRCKEKKVRCNGQRPCNQCKSRSGTICCYGTSESPNLALRLDGQPACKDANIEATTAELPAHLMLVNRLSHSFFIDTNARCSLRKQLIPRWQECWPTTRVARHRSISDEEVRFSARTDF
jgi:hypothetical protein